MVDEAAAEAGGVKARVGPEVGIAAAGAAVARTSLPASGAGASVAGGGLCLRFGREGSCETDACD